MNWSTLATNHAFLHQLFPQPPSLRGVRVVEASLHQDGPALRLRIDLNEFPASPPRKWKDGGQNKIQIVVELMVRKIEITQWTTNNIVDIVMSSSSHDETRLELIAAEGVVLRCTGAYARVVSVDAYADLR
jgi:hypothetical protein